MNDTMEYEIQSNMQGWKRKNMERKIRTKVVPEVSMKVTGLNWEEWLEMMEELEEGIEEYLYYNRSL